MELPCIDQSTVLALHKCKVINTKVKKRALNEITHLEILIKH